MPLKRKAGPVARPKEVVGIRKAQSERTRRAIVDSAVKAFAEAGFDGADMRTIADRARVNHGLLHYHFSSKLELWRVCVDELNRLADGSPVVDDDGRSLDWADFDGHEVQFMNAVIRNYVQFAVTHPEWARILMDTTRSAGPRLDYIVEHYQRPRSIRMQGLIRRLQELGHLPPISPLIMQYMLWGMANTIFSMSAEVKRKTGSDPTRDARLIEEQVGAVRTLFLGQAGKASSRKKA